MPAELFNPASGPTPVGRSRGLTVTTSVAIHIAALAAVVIGPLIAGVSMPAAMSRIDAFVAPDQLPAPAPPPQPVTQTRAPDPAFNPDAAPIDAPKEVYPEVERPAENVPQVPGGIRLPIGAGTGAPMPGFGGGTAALAAPPEPKTQGPVRVGGIIEAPRRLTYEPPAYPPIAVSARIEGTVILEAIIDEQGRVTNLRVIRSVPMLDEAARSAVLKWRYTPTSLNGRAVPVIMNVTVTFTLK